MNKHMKKIMSVLIAGAMAVSSLGLTALADEDIAPAPAAEATPAPAEATEAPAEATATPAVTAAPAEATATPAATAAPTTGVNGAYESDNYYKEALSLVSALGIITGYEDGSVRPTESVTRSQMAAIILRLKNTPESSTYSGVFTDVTSTAWYASAVQTAYDLGIINGYGDGKFGPEDPVTYEQVYKMLVCAHNRGGDAENFGGYPAGYMQAGNTLLKLNDKVSGTMGTNADRGLVIKLVYNALLADYAAPNGTDDFGNPKYEVKDTLAAEIFDVYDTKGIVYGTSKKSLIGKDINEGEIAISDDENTNVDYEIVDCTVDGAQDMLGYKVKYFYKADNYGTKTIIALNADSKTSELTIDATDIDVFTGFGTDKPQLSYTYEGSGSRTKDAKLASNLKIVYNGQIVDAEDTKYFGNQSMNDYIKPELGNVKLIDNDGDNVYDVAIISKSMQMLIVSANAKKVNGKVNGVTYKSALTGSTGINVENDSDDKTITVIKAGDELKPKNLKKDDVAIVTLSPDETVIDIVVTGETITGKVGSQSVNADDETVVTVNGKDYVVDKNTIDEINLGVDATFYLDSYGRIGYINNSVSTGKLTGTEKYGWISRIIYDSDNDSYSIKIFDVAEGALKDYTFASTVNFWGGAKNGDKWNTTGTIKLTSPSDLKSLRDAYANDAAILEKLNNDEKVDNLNTAFKLFSYDTKTGNAVKLCKYQSNSSGEITKLFMAVNSSEELTDGSSTACTYDAGYTDVVNKAGMMNGKYSITDDIIELYAPEEEADRTTSSAYKTGKANPDQYLPRDSSGMDVIVAEVDKQKPSVLIRFTESSKKPDSSVGEDGFTSSNNATFIVSSISQAIDADDNPIFNVKGYADGSEVTYKTMDTTSLYVVQSGNLFNNKQYNSGASLWSPITGSNPSDFEKYVHEGDVFVMSTTGSNIKSMIKVGDAANIGKTTDVLWTSNANWTGAAGSIANREGWIYGRVGEVNEEDSVRVTVNTAKSGSAGETISIGADRTLSVCEITYTVDEDGNRKVTKTEVLKDSITAGELEGYSDGEGDMILAKAYRSALQSVYVYRFIKA